MPGRGRSAKARSPPPSAPKPRGGTNPRPPPSRTPPAPRLQAVGQIPGRPLAALVDGRPGNGVQQLRVSEDHLTSWVVHGEHVQQHQLGKIILEGRGV